MSNAIKYFRKKKKINQAEIAAAIGLDQPTFSKMENNKCNPTEEQALIIARMLEVLVTDIVKIDKDWFHRRDL